MTAVAEIEEELVFTSLVSTPCDGWCPRDTIALIPRISNPSGADLLCVDGAVEGPVHHIIGREHYNGFDFAIAVLSFLTILDELLVVVGAIDI